MQTTIELDGQPAEWLDGSLWQFGFEVPPRETVTVCAWCDPEQRLTKQLVAAGHQVSHGICREHLEQQRPRRCACDICREKEAA